jgi:hypothetical protein
MKKYQQLTIAALLGNISFAEVKALSLKCKSTNDFDSWGWSDPDEEETTPANSTGSKNEDASVSALPGSNSRLRGKKNCKPHCNWDCDHCHHCDGDDCCPCHEEFDEVHCALDDICDKLCMIEHS